MYEWLDSDLNPKENNRLGFEPKGNVRFVPNQIKLFFFDFCIDIDCIDASVADPGCLSQIQGQKDLGSGSASNIFLSSGKCDPGS